MIVYGDRYGYRSKETSHFTFRHMGETIGGDYIG